MLRLLPVLQVTSLNAILTSAFLNPVTSQVLDFFVPGTVSYPASELVPPYGTWEMTNSTVCAPAFSTQVY